MENKEKIYPNSIGIEKCVLGSMILNKDALNYGISNIIPEYFFDLVNREIFKIICNLYSSDNIVDEIIIIDKLLNSSVIDKSLVDIYINSIINDFVTSNNISKHVNILKEKYQLRRIIDSSEKAIADSCAQIDSKEIIDNINNILFDINKSSTQIKFYKISDIIPEAFEQIEIYKKRGEVSGIPTGFKELDKITTGLHEGELIILAGRPGTGKTSLSLSIAINAVFKKKKVLFFSLEMSKEQIIQRILCMQSCVCLHRLRSGSLLIPEFIKIETAARELFKTDFVICDKSGISISEIKNNINMYLNGNNIDLIIIDYLQLIKGNGKFENKQAEVSLISKELKELSKNIKCPVLSLSQLSRAVEARSNSNHRPQLSDLRDSGSIEQDADMVWLLYYSYNYTKDESERNISELIIGKNRNGPLENIKLSFIPEYTKFDNIDSTLTDNYIQF